REEIVSSSRKALQPVNTAYKAYASPTGETNWVPESVRVWVNGVDVTDSPGMFTIHAAAGTVIFSTALTADDVVEAAFDYLSRTARSDFATGITLEGQPQELPLSYVPVASTFKLYANGYDVPREAYLLDPMSKKVT